jgi:hypothetical protein
MRTTPITLKASDESEGLHYVYFWVGTITEPREAWDPVSAKIWIILNAQKAADVAANVHITPLKDISASGTVKLQVMPAGTRREQAEKWIETAEGREWSLGVVGGSLCAVVLDMPK